MAGRTWRRQAARRTNKDIRIKAIVDHFNNYTYVTALGRQVNNYYIESMEDETGLNKPKVDKMTVDEIAVEESGPHLLDYYKFNDCIAKC